MRTRRFEKSAIVAIAVALTVALAGVSSAAPRSGPTALTKHVARASSADGASPADAGSGESEELMDRSEQYAAVRTAPADRVSAEAFQAAARQAAALPAMPGAWQELT